MKYDHRYHAGNFADLLKHMVFHNVLMYMQQKPQPVHIIDTHAGFGAYPMSELTEEASTGIEALLQSSPSSPIFANYLQAIAPMVQGQLFPGSPMLAAISKRDCDPFWAFETQEAPFLALKETLSSFDKTHAQPLNGLQALKGLLPPLSKRCLVLIDPPYERLEEYAEIEATLDVCASRFLQGTYILWYPHSKRLGVLSPILQKARRLWGDKVLTIDYYLQDKNPDEGLVGSGLLILNPPFVLRENLLQAMSDFQALGLEVVIS